MPSIAAASEAELAKKHADEQAVMTIFLTCIQKQAIALDDRMSDPRSIATGAQTACATYEDQVVKVYWTNMPTGGLDARKAIEEATRKSSSDFAVMTVLKHRTGKVAPKPTPSTDPKNTL